MKYEQLSLSDKKRYDFLTTEAKRIIDGYQTFKVKNVDIWYIGQHTAQQINIYLKNDKITQITQRTFELINMEIKEYITNAQQVRLVYDTLKQCYKFFTIFEF